MIEPYMSIGDAELAVFRRSHEEGWNRPLPFRIGGKPVLIDLYCCAGGATKGYQDAGFYVIGVDIEPQPHYIGDIFIQMDVLEFLARLAVDGYVVNPAGGYLPGSQIPVIKLSHIAAWHASPPCQFHSAMSNCRDGLAATYLDLIPETRDFLEWFGIPYVIENVMGAPLRPDLILCGMMFGRELYRHRLFESNIPLTQPDHPEHIIPASKAGHWVPGTIMSVAGHVAPVAHARRIMEIDWTTRDELTEAIPPYFAEHVALDLLAYIESEVAA